MIRIIILRLERHKYVLLLDFAVAGHRYQIHVYAFSGLPQKTPYGAWVDMDAEKGVKIFADLQVRDQELLNYYFDLKTPYAYLPFFEENSMEYQTVLHALNESLRLVDLRESYSEKFYDTIRKANQNLINSLYFKKFGENGKATMIGHTHIDLAWLWRYEHTRDKAVRSFSTAVKLLNEENDYLFMSSQAQLYEFVKEEQLVLYQEIHKFVKEGRWEAKGTMWVEPDMNLSSGESIVHQILYGKRFFQQEFGVDCKVLWLPDVFGYSAALPHILKLMGIKFFMNAKLGTNERNRFPYDTFLWKGIDGSKIFSHLISYLPGVYNPDIENGEILEEWRKYQQKDINDDILIPFEFADGGGSFPKERFDQGMKKCS